MAFLHWVLEYMGIADYGQMSDWSYGSAGTTGLYKEMEFWYGLGRVRLGPSLNVSKALV
jgi:hypothetical protein